MSLALNARNRSVQPSPTLGLQAEVSRLKSEGKQVIGLAAGEPDFTTPQHIIDAAARSLNEGKTKYTPASGIPELRAAVAEWLSAHRKASYTPSQAVITNGGKQALHLTMDALLEPGDEVIIPTPYWVSFSAQALLTGAKPVLVPLEEQAGFGLDMDKVKAALTPKSRILMICSPGNPTGSIYTPEQLAEAAKLAQERDLLIIADETYDRLVYPPATFTSLLDVAPEVADRTILVGSFSKTYAMTGWRVGYAAGPEAVIKALGKIMSHSTSNVSSPAQYGALEALQGSQECVAEMLAIFDRRRHLAMRLLDEIPGVTYVKPQGAFYVFANLGAFFPAKAGDTTIENATDFSSHLLREHGVAVVPGAGFGDDRFVRLSYATADDLLEQGLAAMKTCLTDLRHE